MPDDTRGPGAQGDTMPEVTVRELVEDPQLTVELRRIAGESGLGRPLRHPRVQKNGLVLAGHYQGVVPTRVQLLGETELSYLDSLSQEGRSVAARGFFSLGLSCVVLSGGREPPRAFVSAAEATGTPLFATASRSSRTINALHAVLDDRLAPHTRLHGVLVDVFGVGILLLGKSGIGKSECALDLVVRGHRLVADDAVEITRRGAVLVGTSPPLTRHHMEVRGLGIMNVQDLFGVASTRHSMQVEFIVRLVRWDVHTEYERLGLDEQTEPLLGLPVPVVTLPVGPGRNIGILVEVAARRHLLLARGISAAQRLAARLDAELQAGES